MRLSPITWRRSLLVAGIAAYCPHVLMALFTLAFVDCEHCTVASAQILPVSPGLLATGMIAYQLGLRGSLTLGWVCSGVTTAAFIVAVAAFGRLGRAGLTGAAVTAFITGGIAAFITLKMMQA